MAIGGPPPCPQPGVRRCASIPATRRVRAIACCRDSDNGNEARGRQLRGRTAGAARPSLASANGTASAPEEGLLNRRLDSCGDCCLRRSAAGRTGMHSSGAVRRNGNAMPFALPCGAGRLGRTLRTRVRRYRSASCDIRRSACVRLCTRAALIGSVRMRFIGFNPLLGDDQWRRDFNDEGLASTMLCAIALPGHV